MTAAGETKYFDTLRIYTISNIIMKYNNIIFLYVLKVVAVSGECKLLKHPVFFVGDWTKRNWRLKSNF